ncbi:MAG: hypothetical protein EG825_02075 [Rhodocyclaceae bacterium]|nr:hypothetical protein [Rhodocyclaceae bacterium]
MVWAWPVLAGAASLGLSLGSVRHPAFEADGIAVNLDLGREGEAEIRAARLRVAGVEYRDLAINCSDFSVAADGAIRCPQGQIRRNDERSRAGVERPALPFAFSYRPADGHLELSVAGSEAVAWSPLVKRLRGWKPEGRADLRLVMDRQRAELSLQLEGLRFASRTGDVTGEGITLSLEAKAERRGKAWAWHTSAEWSRGALFYAPWRPRAGILMEAQGHLDDQTLAITLARLELPGLGFATASLNWDRLRGEAREWGFVTDSLDLAAAMDDWVQPWLSELGFAKWQASGKALFSAAGRGAKLQTFYAGLVDARLADTTGALELRGVSARIPWRQGEASEAEFGVGAGNIGELPLGAFNFPLHLKGAEARVSNLKAPLLDGRFEIEDFHLMRGASGWEGEFAGGIEEVSMPKLSRALRLPQMGGNLTARIPRVALSDGILALDGALALEIFDGGITVHRLRLIDPFSSSRRLVADVTARNLDLGLLTRTFSFGSIEGRFDADLRDLEFVGWKPVRFEARIASSAGDYPRVLSLGALQDITSLDAAGSGQKGEAIRRMPERSIGGFGYARIGFGCVLRDGVCLLEGVDGKNVGKGEGIVLMEGAGMPSVNIIGYNRRIDWEALVARFREVIAGKPGVVIE